MARIQCAILGCACACHRAQQRQVPRLWTPEMDQVLTDALTRGEHPRVIAARMHLSLDSIRWRIKALGLSLRDGWRSRQEVAAVLGVSRRSVDRWARQNLLVVTRHGTRWTRITDADLAVFVRSQAGLLLDPTSITDRQLRSLAETAAVANRRRAG